MNKTLKEIYHWDDIDNPNTALLKHVHRFLNKTPEELDLSDISMLVRQKLFLDITIPAAIAIIKNNHSAGDNYQYSLLFNLSNMETPLNLFKEMIIELIVILEEDYVGIQFELETDKQDYLESIKRLKMKIK